MIYASGKKEAPPNSAAAFRWTQKDGMQSVADLLTAAGVYTTGWQLQSATGVSANGTVVVGYGLDPSGTQEGWVAHLPLPSPNVDGGLNPRISGGGTAFW